VGWRQEALAQIGLLQHSIETASGIGPTNNEDTSN
jgi:hypothetical protein